MKKDLKIIAEITLKLLSKKSVNSLSLNEVKKKSQVKSFEEYIKSKEELLNNINFYFDNILSLRVKNLENSNHKDMIFEIMMMRFDILQDNRKAILSIFKSLQNSPKFIILLLPRLLDSLVLMLSYAKITTRGLKGQIKIKGILIIYISTFLVWTKDESFSLEKTMTVLDKYLDQAGKILNIVK